MCIQIKAIETQVPGPRNSETKPEPQSSVHKWLLIEGGSTQASEKRGNTNHPCNVTPGGGASHSSVLSKGRTLLNMHRVEFQVFITRLCVRYDIWRLQEA